jgi:predicted O-methyltransferase YrrM
MIVQPEIEKYILGLVPARDEVLAEMEREAARRRIPIVGPAVGALLSLLVRLCQAKRIFELGSAIGYSTIWLARAAGPGAEVHYTDFSEANACEARAYFQRAGVADCITLHAGGALDALMQTSGDFDLIFNDVDKAGYPAVLDVASGRLRSGGVLITDNTLWNGRVLKPMDPASHAVSEFNRKLLERKDFVTSLLPLRDGVSVALKL